MTDRGDVTLLLAQIKTGDEEAAARLIPLVYKELRKMAGMMMRQERAGHTLQPTAVVHEAFLRLLDGDQPRYENRAHFFAIAARSMRRVLVDHARRRLANKRGGEGYQRVELDENVAVATAASQEVLGLDEALTKLEGVSPRQSQIVEMHYFAGNSVVEIAHFLELGERTVKRELQAARQFLKEQLKTAER